MLACDFLERILVLVEQSFGGLVAQIVWQITAVLDVHIYLFSSAVQFIFFICLHVTL